MAADRRRIRVGDGREVDALRPGVILRHEETGAIIVLVRHCFDWETVQLNHASGHHPGWISYLHPKDAQAWTIIGETEDPRRMPDGPPIDLVHLKYPPNLTQTFCGRPVVDADVTTVQLATCRYCLNGADAKIFNWPPSPEPAP